MAIKSSYYLGEGGGADIEGTEVVSNEGPLWGTVDFTAGNDSVLGTDVIGALTTEGTDAGLSKVDDEYWSMPVRAPDGVNLFRIQTYRDTATPTQADPNPDPVWVYGDEEVFVWGPGARTDEEERFISLSSVASERRGSGALGSIRVNYDSSPGSGTATETLRFRKNPATSGAAFPKCQIRVQPLGVFGNALQISDLETDATLSGTGTTANPLGVTVSLTAAQKTQLLALDVRSIQDPTLDGDDLTINYTDASGTAQTVTVDLSSVSGTGSTVTTGTDAPDNASGENGDVYIRTGATSPGIYFKAAGTWSNILEPGEDGADGTTVDAAFIAGQTTPSDSDVSTNSDAISLLGRGSWKTDPELVNVPLDAILGAVDASKFTSGEDAPANADGENGDFYIRTGSTMPGIYLKANGSWSRILEPGTGGGGGGGTTVSQGAAAPTGGSAGDFYVRTGSTEPGIWYNNAGTWGRILALGEDGDDGDDGRDGDEQRIILRRSSTALTTVDDAGGSWVRATRNFTPPTDWFITIPAGTDPIYASIATLSGTADTFITTPPFLFTGPAGSIGEKGWSPLLAVVTPSGDATKRVLQVQDWHGGQGNKPPTGRYVGSSGLVTDIANAVDIRGPAGSGGGGGTTVAANPTGTDGSDLTRIRIDGQNYNVQIPDGHDLPTTIYNGAGNSITAGQLIVLGGTLPDDIDEPVGIHGDDASHTSSAQRDLHIPLGIATATIAQHTTGQAFKSGILQKELTTRASDTITWERGDTVYIIQNDPTGTGHTYYVYTNVRQANSYAVGQVVKIEAGENPWVHWDFSNPQLIVEDEGEDNPAQVTADEADAATLTELRSYAPNDIRRIIGQLFNALDEFSYNAGTGAITYNPLTEEEAVDAALTRLATLDGFTYDASNNTLTFNPTTANQEAIVDAALTRLATLDEFDYDAGTNTLTFTGGSGGGGGGGGLDSEVVGTFSFAATASLTAVDTGINISALTEEFLAVNFGDDTGTGNIHPGQWQIIRREDLTGRANTSVGDLVQNADNKWRRFSTPQSGGDSDPSIFYLGISSAGNVMIAAQDSSEDALPFVVRRITGGGGTNVVANPTTTATDTVNKLTVGDTTYDLGQNEVVIISSTDDLPEPTAANENKIILRVGTKAEILIQDITGHHITAPVGTFTPLIPRQAPHPSFWGYARPANPSEDEFYYDHQHRRWMIYESTPYQDEFGQEQTRLEWAASYDITELGGAFDDDSIWLGDFETEIEALHHFPGGTYDDSKTYYAFIGGNDRWAGQVRQLQSTPTPTPGGARIELRSWERVSLSHEVADVIHKLSVNGLAFRAGSTQAPVINVPPQWFMGVDEDYIDNVSTALNAAGGLLEGDLHIGPELSQGYHVLSYRRASIATPADDYLGTANGVGTGTVLQLRYVNGSAMEWVSCRVLRPPMPFTDTSVPGRFTIHVEAETKQGAGIAAFANQDLTNVHVSVHTPEERIFPLAQLTRSTANSVRFHTFTNTHPPDIDRNDIDEFLVEVMVSQSDGSPAGATLVRIMRPWEHSTTQGRIVPGNFPSQVPFSWDVADVARLSTGEATRQASESASRGAGVIEYNNTSATAGLEYRFRVDAGAEINSSYGVAYRLSAVVRKGGTLARRW